MLQPPQGAPLPPPTPPVNLGPTPTTTPIPVGAWILLGAALAAVIGALLPWARIGITIGADALSTSVKGTDGDGVLTLVLGLVLGGTAVLALASRTVAAWAAIVAIFAAAIIVVVAIIDIVDVNRTAGDISPLVEVSVGAGLWVTLIAGVAGLVGGLLMLARRTRNR